MKNNILIKLLKSLNKEELQVFGDFVNSPFFNKKTPVLHLFNYLKGFHPDFNDKDKLNRKNIFRVLYPGKPYNYGVMKNIIFDLNLLGEKFLELFRYSKKRAEQYRYLLEELTERDLDKSFRKNLKNAERLLQEGNKGDIYFRDKMDLELLRFNYHIKNSGRTKKPEFDLNAGNSLLSYFLTKFFKINYNIQLDMTNFGVHQHISFLDEVLNYIQTTPEIDPIILLYYNKFMLAYKENETYYNNFKSLVKEEIKNLGRKEQFNTYVNLLNYCYAKIASGESKYYNDLFEIYNEMVDNNILTITGKDHLDAVIFRLAVETALKLRKFDWAKHFIEQYSQKLPPELRTNEINIAYANYYFILKSYDNAQEYIAQTQLNSVYDKVYVYIIQSMLFYETKQFEMLISEVDAIRHFITNDKILSIENRNGFRKYVNYLNELVNLNIREETHRDLNINKIKKRLVSEDSTLEKQWLLEKLDEF